MTFYYLELKQKEIEIGKNTGSNYHRQAMVSFPREQLAEHQLSSYIPTQSDETVLVFIHALWGGAKNAHQHSLKKLSTISGIDKIISVVWHADHLFYKKAWDLSIAQGALISPLINTFVGTNQCHNFVLCHSMGHRIFEGTVKMGSSEQLRYQGVILAAADLDIDVFENNMVHLYEVPKIVIYVHQNDWLLSMSKVRHQRDRLGLNAHEHLERWQDHPNLEIIDVTYSQAGRRLKMVNHSYFKNNQMALKDLEYVINQQDAERIHTLTNRQTNFAELR